MDNALDRRSVLSSALALGASVADPTWGKSLNAPRNGFVTRVGQQLQLGGKPYRFAGANMWYAAFLGADAPWGDRARLGRELDRLAGLGVKNIRILASAEEGPLNHAIRPGFQKQNGELNNALLIGLDYAMAELGRRGMKAVLYLTNFWEWSGGMMTYLYYANGQFMNMGDPAHPWPQFPDATSQFYGNDKAVGLFFSYVRQIVGRTNSVTGQAYADDRALMAWQLCNEPRPGGSDDVIAKNLPAYYEWIKNSASLIRAMDKNHLVSLGHEGSIAANMHEEVVTNAHAHIDYVTAHIWPLNWGWVNGKDLSGTWDAGRAKVVAYLDAHIALAKAMDKPLIIEEFGFPRDGELYGPEVATTYREHFYRLIYNAAIRSRESGGPVCGTGFWAWNGEARAQHADYRFRVGDTHYMGDPPHEPQGWYGNFDSDIKMLALIKAHAHAFAT